MLINSSPHLIGQKVICVDDTFHPQVVEFFDRLPEKDQVYTIDELFWLPQHETRELTLSVRLAELPPLRVTSPRSGFSLWHFRLLEDSIEATSEQSCDAQCRS